MRTRQFFITTAMICIAFLFSTNSAYSFPWQSPYAHAANNPIRYVDVNGDSISFSYQYNANNELTGVTMNVTGKVINVSSNSKVNMQAAANRISNQIASSFSGNVNGVSFSTNVNLSVANSMDDVADSDHVFALADMGSIATPDGSRTPNGGSNMMGGKVAFIDVDYFSGPWDTSFGDTGPRTAGHEFGHLANLSHVTGGSNLMIQGAGNSWGSFGATKINNGQLKSIHGSYIGGYLNLGSNYELIPRVNPTTGRIEMKAMPNRGGVKSVIKY
ncbi:MAG: hypothetical protein LBI82_08280 [Dysgonamonadaceae bacterium]|jgi:hypothetical protein|nr:hypothetical protein [Dysgonamonadaceae bacterium]